jgi:hypothetical protein
LKDIYHAIVRRLLGEPGSNVADLLGSIFPSESNRSISETNPSALPLPTLRNFFSRVYPTPRATLNFHEGKIRF